MHSLASLELHVHDCGIARCCRCRRRHLLVQIGRKRGRGDESSKKSSDRGAAGEQPEGSGSLHDSQDSLSLAASHAQRVLEPELERASTLSEDGTSESMDGRPWVGRAGSKGLPDSDASSTSSLAGKEGGRIRLMLSFDGTRVAGDDGPALREGSATGDRSLEGSAPGDRSAPAGKQRTAQQSQHDGTASAGTVAAPEGHAAGEGGADGRVSTTGKPADTARRKATADEGEAHGQKATAAEVDGVVLGDGVKDAQKQSQAHLQGIALPDGVAAEAALQGKKRTAGKLVDVHASAEDRSAAGRKAAAPGEDGTGG